MGEMKIAMFSEGYDPFLNGVVTSLKTLRRALEQQGHEVVVFAPAYPGHQDEDGGVVRLPSVRLAREAYPALSPFAAYGDVLGSLGFDVIHSQHPFTMGRLAERQAARHGRPLVYTFHTMLNEYGDYVPLLAPLATRWLTHRFVSHCNRADAVLVATGVVGDFLHEHGVRRAIEVVPLGVPPLPAAPGARARVRAALSLSEDAPLLLYVGRLAREKRLDFLLGALARLGAGRAWQACLVGDGPVQGDLRAQAARLGLASRVSFPGWVPREALADWYAAADVFVFPSPADAMGLVLVEAMGAGLPCVAIAKYGPREVVRDGVTGFLTSFEEEHFAVAVRRLLVNPFLRARMQEAARGRAQDFAPEVAAARTVDVYREAIIRCRARTAHLGSAAAWGGVR
jgi:glycosyltransferase involved in cell wall biosynthesis